MLSIRSVTVLVALLGSPFQTFAFQSSIPGSARESLECQTTLNMARNNDNDNASSPTTSRRALFQNLVTTAATVVAVSSASPQPAVAKYSDYTRREKDWQERLGKGEVKVSTARDLRRQLSEIAPMNDEGSKIFCPNGPSAAVTPLMENKCGDRLAIPSVYGRSQDIAGNSIPGFSSSYMSAMAGGGTNSLTADIGGFPSYNAAAIRQQRK